MSFERFCRRAKIDGPHFTKACEAFALIHNENEIFQEGQYVLTPDSLARRWSLSYDLLREQWDTIKAIPRADLDPKLAAKRLWIIFLGANEQEWLSNDIADDAVSDTLTTSPLDKSLQVFLTDLEKVMQSTSNPYSKPSVAIEFIEQLLDPACKFIDKSLIQACQNEGRFDIGKMFVFLDPLSTFDPEEDPITITPSLALEKYLDLHVFRVSVNPRIQAVRMLRGIESIRRTPPEGDYDFVSAASWLISDEHPGIFERSQFAGINDQRHMFDLNAAWSTPNLLETLKVDYFDAREIIFASITSIDLSPSNLTRYITSGMLPNVGTIRMPADAFFIPRNARIGGR